LIRDRKAVCMTNGNGRTHFAITVDVEADNEWAGSSERTYGNLAALPRLQELCDEFGARPTYLVTYDVAAQREGGRILKDLAQTGRCEIGAHLHAWTTPPHVPELEGDPGARPYLSEYQIETQMEKLTNLTEVLGELVDSNPTSYRGGRWDVDIDCLNLLAEAGYLVDTSVTPLVSWRRAGGVTKGGPVHARAPLDPYHPAAADLYSRGHHPILEVPVTVSVMGLLSDATYGRLAESWEHRRPVWAALKRAMKWTGLAKRVWLDPVSTNAQDLIALCKLMIARGAPVLNMAFHSSELMAGCAPSVLDKQAEDQVWACIREVLAFCADQDGVTFATLSGLARTQRVGDREYAGAGIAAAEGN